jgi:MFS family permease
MGGGEVVRDDTVGLSPDVTVLTDHIGAHRLDQGLPGHVGGAREKGVELRVPLGDGHPPIVHHGDVVTQSLVSAPVVAAARQDRGVHPEDDDFRTSPVNPGPPAGRRGPGSGTPGYQGSRSGYKAQPDNDATTPLAGGSSPFPGASSTTSGGTTRPLPAGEPSGRARKAADATRKVAVLSGKAATSAARVARKASRAHGAGETGLYRLIELHAFNAAGDAALAISLAGTLFFAVPSDQARGQVALFLGVTMLPFAVMAPLIGPFLDRLRRGRRWAIGTTMALRALGCWSLAGAVANESAWMFPAALTCLIASKAYGVTRASAVPRLIPEGLTLVKANSRISLAGLAGAAISAPIAGLASLIGPEWSLRYATLVFIGGTVLAILLPSRVDSAEGEEQVGIFDITDSSSRSRKFGITPVVVTALRCNAGLRMLSGFLTLFMAFLLRNQPLPGWEDRKTLLLSLVIGSAGVGSTLGTFLGAMIKSRTPEVIVVTTLVLDAVAAVYAALFFGLIPAMILGLVAGMSQSLGKLSLDALIQREVPERVRTSVFARSETLLQLSWVIGGFLGVFMPLQAKLGLVIVAVMLLAWLAFVLRGLVIGRRSAARAARPQRA